MFTLLSSWATTISLIFGGCCSNAITLEQLTLEYPNAGSVLTFFQFLIISLHGLPKFVIWTRYGPRFRPRRVPFMTYLAQVTLFYLISLLNNAAFAYRIPMAVHIIFRSAGLVISMLLGWLISKKRYNITQILSVLLVTLGVAVTTLSAQSSSAKASTTVFDPYIYAKGIGILTLALVFSGLLGLIQDWTYSKYGRPALISTPSHPAIPGVASEPEGPAPWQESMFYLHFLALPMFIPLLPDLVVQMHKLNTTGPMAELNIPIPIPVSLNLTTAFPAGILPPYSLPRLPIHLFPQSENNSLLSITQSSDHPLLLSLSIPHIYLPLILNTITQLLCVAGVHRLTTRVSALTVTLILVVRKAASLIISVIGVVQVGETLRDWIYIGLEKLSALFGVDLQTPEAGWSFNVAGVDVDGLLKSIGTAFVGAGSGRRAQAMDKSMMWTGATMVLLGTVGYTLGSRGKPKVEKPKRKTE